MTTTLLRPLLRTAVRSRAPLIARYNSTLPPGTTKDDSHPNLYYHLNPPPPSAPESIILSFLPTPPVATSTYLGTLPAVPEAGLNDFKENPQFRKVLHEAVKDGLGKNVSYAIQYEAESRPTDGYITITGELESFMAGQAIFLCPAPASTCLPLTPPPTVNSTNPRRT